jgi:hypothetical protein
LKEIYTVTYLYKNGCVTINQHFAESEADLTILIVSDLTTPKNHDLSEVEKSSLKMNFHHYSDFQLVPIDDSINVWNFSATIYVDIYVTKTSPLISK